MENLPLVSIIIPAYNAEPYIKETIESTLVQTYKHIEILVAHRESGDNTKAILAPYIDSGKIIYINQGGKGLSNARNIAMRQARGEFIALLDADDLFLPEKIEQVVDYFSAHPQCHLCYTGTWHFRDDKPQELLRLNYTYYSGSAVLPNLLNRNFIAPSTVTMRKSVVDRVGFFNEDLRRSEDWEYWMRIAHKGLLVCFLEVTASNLRLHTDSMSYSWSAKMQERKTNLGILKMLKNDMIPAEQEKIPIDRAIFRHRILLAYTYFGNYFIPLQWFHRWIQKNRLK